MRVLPCGDQAVLLDCATAAEARSWQFALADQVPTVLGATTVLLRGRPTQLRALVSATTIDPERRCSGNQVTIEVTYDGPDLPAVAEHCGLNIAEVIAAHTGSSWTVGFAGFAPGFAYLTDGDPRLEVPRLDHPRPQVAAGSVGLAGKFSGIYPRSSPGGWQLIGSTTAVMWDLDRPLPALLQPGDTVTFKQVGQ